MVEISNSWNLVLLMFEFSKKYIHTYRNTYCVFNIYYNNNKKCYLKSIDLYICNDNF